MIRRALIHLMARLRPRKVAPGYDLPAIDSPFADLERYFVASHRMSGARVDYSEQSIAYVEQVAHKLLQWHPQNAEPDEVAALTDDEWQHHADRFVTMCGSYLGSVIILNQGGRWAGSPQARDAMTVEAIAGTSVSCAPFAVAHDRLFGNGGNLWRWYKGVRAEVERERK